MKNIFKITLLVLLFSISGTINAQTTKPAKKAAEKLDRSVMPGPAPAPVINVGKYEQFSLPNGLQVFVVENHKIPRVTYSLVLDIIPMPEEQLTGVSDLTGQLMRTGTTSLTKDELDEEVDFIGASLGTSATGVYGSSLKKHNEKLLQLMSDVLLNPAFRAEELEKIRTQTLSGLKAQQNEPEAISNRISKLLIYGAEHPYGETMTEATVNNITAGDCKAYYDKFFKPNIGYLAIVGDITLEEARTLITKYFSGWEKGDIAKYAPRLPMAPEATQVAIVDRPDAVQTTLKVAYPVQLQPGDADVIQARVMNTILGGGTFRLFNNLREDKAYTYGAYSSLNTDKLVARFMATTAVRNSVTDSSVVEIFNEMNRIRDEEVPMDELQLVKNYMSGNFALSLENPSTVASFAISTARYDLPADYYVNYLKNLAAVTASDVQSAAKKYILPENAYIIAVGKASEIAPRLKQFNKTKAIRYYDYEGKEYDPDKKVKPAPEGLTAADVNKAYIAALGGEKALSKVKDVTILATTSMQGMTIGFDTYRKSPDKFMVKISSGEMVFQQMGYDGTTAKIVSPMGGESKTLDGKELEDMKIEAAMFPELNFEQLGVNQKLEGIEEIKGNETYRVLLTYPSGTQSTRFYDVKTGLLIRETGDQGIAEFSDYREENGIKFPYIISQQAGPQNMDLKVMVVKVNTKLKDELFQLK
ncbi:MAG: pitrilysin family protein [Lentimicrobium sp.]|jgi:predicted Zn-dependent peptidase|nr:pitrilysin family protein [Lentimicrobium sp.]